MKKIFILILVVISVTMTAQKKEKIKGNREVLIKKFIVPSFNTLEIGEHFEVRLAKSTDTTRVVIETDDNLFDVIDFKVEDGVLKFATSKEIVKKKRLRISVYVPEDFHQIKLKERAEVFNKELLSLNNLKIEAVDKSRAELSLQIKNDLSINMYGKSEVEINLLAFENADNSENNSESNLKIKNKLILNAEDRAFAKLEGDIHKFVLSAKDKVEVKASEFIAKEAEVKVSDKAVVNIKISNNLVLNLSGESETYLYGSPKIKLNSFNDNAVLYKK